MRNILIALSEGFYAICNQYSSASACVFVKSDPKAMLSANPLKMVSLTKHQAV